MTNAERFDMAIRLIDEDFPPGREFELSEIFGDDWSREPFGVRTNFGKYFSQQVDSGAVPGVVKAGRGRNNHRFYKKC